ncbi:MAG: hypothetical protein JWS12_660 [Candidatus Saccharibacteria bacterium]|nr:hypothetical protein [Candidatus Saccharibacteria bacterium]
MDLTINNDNHPDKPTLRPALCPDRIKMLQLGRQAGQFFSEIDWAVAECPESCPNPGGNSVPRHTYSILRVIGPETIVCAMRPQPEPDFVIGNHNVVVRHPGL